MASLSTADTSSITQPETNLIRVLGLFVEEVQALLSVSISTNTQLTFPSFVILVIYHTSISPLDHLINFIAYIAFHLKINNFPDINKSFIIQKLLIGLSRKKTYPDIRRHITLPPPHAIIQALPSTCHYVNVNFVHFF